MPAPAHEPMTTGFAEHELVRLRSILYTDAGSIPAGSLGTIVFRHDRDLAYEVEFAGRVCVVATLRPGDLSPAA